MAGGASIKLDRRFYKQARGAIEKYSFEVGIIQDGPHKQARKGLKVFAGGPARKVGRKSTQQISEVSERLRKNSGVEFYRRPFRAKGNRDLLLFVRRFFRVIAGKMEARRLVNTLQAIVRNPILRGEYGANSEQTAKRKGFNRFMIDTGQLFKAIRAKVTVRGVS